MSNHNVFLTPVPSATKTYAPVSHREIVNEIEEQLDKRNLSVVERILNGARDGRQVVGRMYIQNQQDPEIGFQIAFKNSYDKSMTVGFAAGNVAWICSNGLISGNIIYMRKHTGSVAKELKDTINQSIDRLDSHYTQVRYFSNATKMIDVDKTAAAELCGRMFIEHDIISATQLSVLKSEIHNPSFDYKEKNNLWAFYNHTTHALKSSHPLSFIDAHVKFHNFIKQEFNI